MKKTIPTILPWAAAAVFAAFTIALGIIAQGLRGQVDDRNDQIARLSVGQEVFYRLALAGQKTDAVIVNHCGLLEEDLAVCNEFIKSLQARLEAGLYDYQAPTDLGLPLEFRQLAESLTGSSKTSDEDLIESWNKQDPDPWWNGVDKRSLLETLILNLKLSALGQQSVIPEELLTPTP